MRTCDRVKDLDERVASGRRERVTEVAETEAEGNEHDESERPVDDRRPHHSSWQDV
jgi:hypothetical protein